MTSEKTVWIIGASQGIGKALAIQLHAEGALVILSARSEEPLRELAVQLGDRSEVLPVDVADSESLKRAAESVYQRHAKLDSVVFLAATYHPMKLDKLDMSAVSDTLAINLEGAFNLVHAVFAEMKRRQAGQIVLCGSVAGYRGLPAAQPYAATKAAMVSLAETLYLEAKGTNVDIKLLSPGFVRTRLTDKNNFSMPAIIEPEEAAQFICKGMKSGKFEIHFPKRLSLTLKLLRLLPYSLYFRITGSRRSEN